MNQMMQYCNTQVTSVPVFTVILRESSSVKDFLLGYNHQFSQTKHVYTNGI